ncbi:hypothetical protein W97_04453 [Coniosporium apollinis CBS 100218]|uniref:Carboxylic ester hydrolase n=1 Tax=Coniosporium apollinis (strain CBS 100218) TaxID=1168221 RepID=R7YU76_CONA1|nr:uncharacterized protein W97_04453 [Coniosporium apollinis CBS 100218]EON65216.1 hypothetical protein W97_04453 [Coniosporium apollinis CBS 100218]
MRAYGLQLLASVSLLGLATAQQNDSLPTVDLGYELHQAAYYNDTGRFYNFSNIRFAAPPLGNLRFAAPQPPAVNRSEVQTGSVGRICPQAAGAWSSIAAQFVPAYLAGIPFNGTSSSSNSSGSTSLPPQDPRTSEDCLFLDVVVPEEVLGNAGHGFGAPVLVWIYGGGYTGGSKSAAGNPAGLLARGENSTAEGVIYVAMNYRLGAFGWLSGPSLQSNGTANAGLHDQRLALEWVQDNIHLFGGDPNRVTVIGESAGGGSIMHQMTAYGGKNGSVPFQQAIPQSPGWAPQTSNYQQEQQLNAFLALLNVSTIQEARELPSEALITANLIQVGRSPYGTFTYGPTVDGDFVPALPGVSLLHGNFDRRVRVMVGHNANEGLLFTSPFITNDTAYEAYIRRNIPSATNDVIEYITNTLYPPVFDGSEGYTDQIGRVSKTLSEQVFTCNSNYLGRAYGNETYAYFFAVPPALHGQDVAYTYYNGPSRSVVNQTVALVLQEFITSFAATGRPSAEGVEGVPMFDLYGPEASIVNLNVTGITDGIDRTANERCLWWQKALYF